MSHSIIVIKLGSSVLIDPSHVVVAAKELNRYVSQGYKVVAVVSAFAGETDRLFAGVAEVDPSADPHRVADFVTTGEAQSACLLRIALESSATPARAISPTDCGLMADGDPLDADPFEVQVSFFNELFDHVDVAVIPGFIASDKHGRSVLLGRGGSDDTALFLAQQLSAECRLIKDVDGIFEYDPARPGPAPRQFDTISWEDAAEVAGVLVQPKAIKFAQKHKLQFSVSALHSKDGTKVGHGPTSFHRVN